MCWFVGWSGLLHKHKRNENDRKHNVVVQKINLNFSLAKLLYKRSTIIQAYLVESFKKKGMLKNKGQDQGKKENG